MKVLLVDDSTTMRKIQRKTLSALGYDAIDEAGDGVMALERVAADPPDMILLDWNMPNMDGLTFLKSYRADGGQAAVIMVTTEAEKSRVIEAIRAGVDNYVIKPFSPEKLGDTLRETLAKRAA